MKARKIIIPVSIIAGIAAIGAAIAALGSAASTVTYADTVKIQEKTIENKISVSGTVKSADVQKVYSKLSYPVEKINVSVGDAVKKGDILCTISTEDLQQQILQQQTTVDNSGISEEYNVSSAEEKYLEALETYEKGENPSLISAKKAITQAEKALENAKRDESLGLDSTIPNALDSADTQVKSAKDAYDKSVEAYNKAVAELEPKNHPATIKQLYDNLEELKERYEVIRTTEHILELENARKRYDNAKVEKSTLSIYPADYAASKSDEIAEELADAQAELAKLEAKYDRESVKEQIDAAQVQYDNAIEGLEKARDSAEAAMESAKTAYDNAVKAYGKTEKNNVTTEENYSIAVKNAEDALEDAKRSYELAVQQVETDLAALKKAAEQQRTLSGLNDPQVIILENLKSKLEYAVIVAPCDGIITAVNAEEGVMANGAMFVIEDLSDLVVSANVGEYDIPYVAEGMTATVKCDAVAGVEYDGKVSSVAPTGVPGNSGTSYAIEADIDSEDGKILVGMSAKLAIISDKRENALTVTYDALTTDENGNDAIFVAEKDENGVYHAKLVNVEIGLETDYEIEIISKEISEGMYVLTNTTMLSDGDMVMIEEGESEETAETEQVAE
ncbi:MAG: efflux RND transporter periplasmic adaptor subunit [Oscillospiraceae bacterium]|nr:efflux RND transporter periplasmic adaptor subunit [Oscillospiraceae bacterium]